MHMRLKVLFDSQGIKVLWSLRDRAQSLCGPFGICHGAKVVNGSDEVD